MPTFRRNILSPSSGLKVETACFSEALASTNKSTWCQNPDHHHHHHPHYHENLKCHIFNMVWIILIVASSWFMRCGSPWSRDLGKLIITQLVKKCPTFYGTWVVFPCLQEPTTEPDESSPHCHILFEGFLKNIHICLTHVCDISCKSHPWFGHPNIWRVQMMVTQFSWTSSYSVPKSKYCKPSLVKFFQSVFFP
jgi:hypothetical protein